MSIRTTSGRTLVRRRVRTDVYRTLGPARLVTWRLVVPVPLRVAARRSGVVCRAVIRSVATAPAAETATTTIGLARPR